MQLSVEVMVGLKDILLYYILHCKPIPGIAKIDITQLTLEGLILSDIATYIFSV